MTSHPHRFTTVNEPDLVLDFEVTWQPSSPNQVNDPATPFHNSRHDFLQFGFQVIRDLADYGEQSSCVICLSDFPNHASMSHPVDDPRLPENPIVKIMPCEHVFCWQCITQWTSPENSGLSNNTCPLCRRCLFPREYTGSNAVPLLPRIQLPSVQPFIPTDFRPTVGGLRLPQAHADTRQSAVSEFSDEDEDTTIETTDEDADGDEDDELENIPPPVPGNHGSEDDLRAAARERSQIRQEQEPHRRIENLIREMEAVEEDLRERERSVSDREATVIWEERATGTQGPWLQNANHHDDLRNWARTLRERERRLNDRETAVSERFLALVAHEDIGEMQYSLIQRIRRNRDLAQLRSLSIIMDSPADLDPAVRAAQDGLIWEIRGMNTVEEIMNFRAAALANMRNVRPGAAAPRPPPAPAAGPAPPQPTQGRGVPLPGSAEIGRITVAQVPPAGPRAQATIRPTAAATTAATAPTTGQAARHILTPVSRLAQPTSSTGSSRGRPNVTTRAQALRQAQEANSSPSTRDPQSLRRPREEDDDDKAEEPERRVRRKTAKK